MRWSEASSGRSSTLTITAGASAMVDATSLLVRVVATDFPQGSSGQSSSWLQTSSWSQSVQACSKTPPEAEHRDG